MKVGVWIALLLLAATSIYAGGSPAISGDYAEVRSNEVYTCGCRFSGQSDLAATEAILAWRIDSGSIDGVPLAGSKMVAVVAGKDNLERQQAPRKSVLFVDAPQTQPLLSLASRYFSEIIGEIVAVKAVPIEFEIDGDRALVRLDGVEVSLRRAVLPDDAHDGSYRWYEPFVPTTEWTLGVALRNEYWRDGLNRRWRITDPEITGYFGSFELPGE